MLDSADLGSIFFCQNFPHLNLSPKEDFQIRLLTEAVYLKCAFFKKPIHLNRSHYAFEDTVVRVTNVSFSTSNNSCIKFQVEMFMESLIMQEKLIKTYSIK